MKKILTMISAVIILTGCSAHYFLDGKKYDNETLFQGAVEAKRQDALASIQPLPSPLTNKRLIVAIPSEQAVYEENSRRHLANTGKELSGIGIEQNRNLSKANFKLAKAFFEGVQKRGVYSGIEIKETGSMTNSIEPSPDYDVMYYTEPAVNSGQYFYASSKHGRQIFSYDRSQPGATAQLNNFINAVQTFAIRD